MLGLSPTAAFVVALISGVLAFVFDSIGAPGFVVVLAWIICAVALVLGLVGLLRGGARAP